MARAPALNDETGPLEQSRDRDARLILELVRGHAPRSMLTFEGFTSSEISGARADVSLETARPGNSDPAAGRPTLTPATGQRGATGSTDATTAALEGAATRGRGALEAREPARAAHSGNTGGTRVQ